MISEYHDNRDHRTFKHIRAMLGMHPNNLIIESNKYYASWCSCNKNIIELFLWSKQNNIRVEIDIQDLLDFLNDITIKLRELMLEIPKLIYSYKNDFREKEIKKTDDILSQIDILEEEADNRVPTYHLDEYLEDYRLIILSDCKNSEMCKCKDIILEKITLMLNDLQNMEMKSNDDYRVSQICIDNIEP